MGKFKIPKNRDISEMFAGVEEKETFETAIWEEEQPSVKKHKSAPKQSAAALRRQFFDEDLQEKVGNLLLEIKLAYYKDGIGDISLEVVKNGRNIEIKTHPKKRKKKDGE